MSFSALVSNLPGQCTMTHQSKLKLWCQCYSCSHDWSVLLNQCLPGQHIWFFKPHMWQWWHKDCLITWLSFFVILLIPIMPRQYWWQILNTIFYLIAGFSTKILHFWEGDITIRFTLGWTAFHQGFIKDGTPVFMHNIEGTTKHNFLYLHNSLAFLY